MTSQKIELFVYHRAKHGEDINVRHNEIVSRMRDLPEPFGWSKMTVPTAPDFGEELQATFFAKYPDYPINLYVEYIFREESYAYTDEIIFDDKMVVGFRVPSKQISYSDTLRQHLPLIIQAFRGYQAKVYFGSYSLKYQDLHKFIVEQLEAQSKIDLDGRNNIFTLHPAQYWDAELCRKALGYGPDEVIRRLDGQVPSVKPLMDGVYTVFNDDPNMSFEEFCAINDRFKPILGLA